MIFFCDATNVAKLFRFGMNRDRLFSTRIEDSK
nr:MAG TPA: hypothetical protein [Caudoviricetes sp.]